MAGCVKYLFGYVYKGYDRAMLEFTRKHAENPEIRSDEIKMYLDCRVVGNSEALWRIYDFPMQEMDPAVERLAVHLEGEQTVNFPETAPLPAIVAGGPPDTTLTAWYDLNRRIHEHPQLFQKLPATSFRCSISCACY